LLVRIACPLSSKSHGITKASETSCRKCYAMRKKKSLA